MRCKVLLHLFLAMGKSKKRSNEAAAESDKARAKQRRDELAELARNRKATKTQLQELTELLLKEAGSQEGDKEEGLYSSVA